MNLYLTRVELHGAAAEATYISLHNAMIAAGFSRKITAADGKEYWLPTAMYVSSSSSIDSVLQAASLAAQESGLTSTILVGHLNQWLSRGLKPVD